MSYLKFAGLFGKSSSRKPVRRTRITKRFTRPLGFLCLEDRRLLASILGTAESFAALGASTVTNTGSTTITGDVGVAPGPSITGFAIPPANTVVEGPGSTGLVDGPGLVTGTIYISHAVAQQAQVDTAIAYAGLAAMPFTSNLTGQDLGGMTLTSGVYHFDTSAQLTGTLQLDAEGNNNAFWVFQIGSTLTTASSSSVVIINEGSNGGSDNGVFWQVGSSATLGTSTSFEGNILALASITLNTAAQILCGRALAQTGAVTLDTNLISNVCENGGPGNSGGLEFDESGNVVPIAPAALGSIAWEKRATDANPVLLAGATFEISPNPLTGEGTLTVVDGGANDADGLANGVLQVNNVLLGTYTITETIPPPGFANDDVPSRTITVSSEELNPVIGEQGSDQPGDTNESDFHDRLVGSIAFEKRTDASPFPLQGGATFSISPNPLTGLGTLIVVDGGAGDADGLANGVLQIDNVLLGTYTITETVAPLGFRLDNDPIRVVTVSEGDLSAVIGTQGVDDPGDTDESDFHNRQLLVVITPDKMNCSLPFVHVVNAVTGELVARFLAYEETYRGGVRVATGDLNGDGIAEIVTAPGRGHTPLVKIFDQAGNLLNSFLAFSGSFNGGVDLAIGDVTGDGLNDIAAAMSYNGNQITVFRNTSVLPTSTPTFTALGSFFPFGPSFKGGATVELADLGTPVTIGGVRQLDSTQFDPTGRAEVIAASESGLAPTVKVFAYFGTAATPSLVRTFRPFTPSFRGGLSLDVALINADLVPDIIVGAGNGGNSQVQILDGVTTGVIGQFTAFTPGDTSSYNAPLDVAALDEDGDGIAEVILVAQGSDGAAGEVRRFDALTGTLLGALPESAFDSLLQGNPIDDFCGAYFVAPLENPGLPFVDVVAAATGQVTRLLAYGPTYFGGVHVASGDLNGDGVDEIVTSPGRNYQPLVRIFDQEGNLLKEFLAYSRAFKGGVDVAVGDVNGDGKIDIATSMVSGGSQVKVFKNTSLVSGPFSSLAFASPSAFYPFGSRFKGGAVVELADLGQPMTIRGVKQLDASQFDGKAEVIVANQSGLRATVKVFSYFGASRTATAVRTYLPLESTFRGGLSLDVARIDGDLAPDIIVGAGRGGGSRVQVLSGASTGVIRSFSAFTAGESPNYNAKLDVKALDADNDGLAEFILAARDFDGKSREVRRFHALTGELVDAFFESYAGV